MLVEGSIFHDERGYFRRLSTAGEAVAVGMPESFRQQGASFNLRRGTVRGLHFQKAPFLEHKLVQCVRGAIFDVMLDLRPDSPTYGRHFRAERSEAHGRMLYSRPGSAHGFQAPRGDCLGLSQSSADVVQGGARAGRWNDPDLGIAWPLDAVNVSESDQRAPLFRQHDRALTAPQP